MPHLETPDELADAVANWLDIYGAHSDDESKPCRVCFVFNFSDRVRMAVRNEQTLLHAACGGTGRRTP